MEIDTKKLMKLRIAKGLSQYELSRETGLSKAGINRVESGKYKNPSFKTMVIWTQYLGVSILSILKQ